MGGRGGRVNVCMCVCETVWGGVGTCECVDVFICGSVRVRVGRGEHVMCGCVYVCVCESVCGEG